MTELFNTRMNYWEQLWSLLAGSKYSSVSPLFRIVWMDLLRGGQIKLVIQPKVFAIHYNPKGGSGT